MPVDKVTDARGVEHVRGYHGGPFIADPRNLTRDNEALRLRAEEGLTYAEIAERIGVNSPASAQNAVKRAITRKYPLAKEHADALRAEENRKLDEAEQKVWEVFRDPGYASGSSGRVVIDPDTGRPQADRRAVLSAIERLVSISRRRAALNGLDIPVETRTRVTVTTEQDREIAALAASLIAAGRADDVARSLVAAIDETAPRAVVAGELAGTGQIGAELPPSGQNGP